MLSRRTLRSRRPLLDDSVAVLHLHSGIMGKRAELGQLCVPMNVLVTGHCDIMRLYLLAEGLVNISAKSIQSHQGQHSDTHWVGHDGVANSGTVVQEIHAGFETITVAMLHLLDRVHE